MKTIAQWVPKLLFCVMCLKITLWKLLPNIPGANELKHSKLWLHSQRLDICSLTFLNCRQCFIKLRIYTVCLATENRQKSCYCLSTWFSKSTEIDRFIKQHISSLCLFTMSKKWRSLWKAMPFYLAKVTHRLDLNLKSLCTLHPHHWGMDHLLQCCTNTVARSPNATYKSPLDGPVGD